MRKRLLKLIEDNPNLTLENLEAILGVNKNEIAKELDKLREEEIIKGEKTVIDWSKVEDTLLKSIIMLNIRPQRDTGFDEIAKRISNLDEVESCELLSGAYDLLVIVHGESFQDIAAFVAKKLSPMDNVLTTQTCFILKTYKKDNYMFTEDDTDMRVDA